MNKPANSTNWVLRIAIILFVLKYSAGFILYFLFIFLFWIAPALEIISKWLDKVLWLYKMYVSPIMHVLYVILMLVLPVLPAYLLYFNLRKNISSGDRAIEYGMACWFISYTILTTAWISIIQFKQNFDVAKAIEARTYLATLLAAALVAVPIGVSAFYARRRYCNHKARCIVLKIK